MASYQVPNIGEGSAISKVLQGVFQVVWPGLHQRKERSINALIFPPNNSSNETILQLKL
jgi:hypothetical protein